MTNLMASRCSLCVILSYLLGKQIYKYSQLPEEEVVLSSKNPKPLSVLPGGAWNYSSIIIGHV